MKVYFSKNRTNELHCYYQQIAPMFNVNEQGKMQKFLTEIERSGCCDIENYNNIYSILNIVEDRNIKNSERKKQKTKEDNKEDFQDTVECIKILELIRLQFATRYYISQNICDEPKYKGIEQSKY